MKDTNYYFESCRGKLGCKVSQARIQVTTEATIFKKTSLNMTWYKWDWSKILSS